MKSNYRFHWAHKKHYPGARFIITGTVVIAIMALVLAQVSNPTYGLHKETALLEKYNSLEDLVHDIRNGDVDFKQYRNSDGIPLKVMKDSEIYDKMDISTQNCIDLAGKIGNELGDREIVHCSEDSSYFKNKYQPNNSLPASTTASPRTNDTATDTQNHTTTATKNYPALSTSTSSDTKENLLRNELVKTGKFTENEAIEFVIIHGLLKSGFTKDQAAQFAVKIMQSSNQIPSTDVIPKTSKTPVGSNDDVATTNTATSKTDTDEIDALSTINQGNKDKSQVKPDNPEDYNDLSQLVADIKNGDLDADEITREDFQKSGAYNTADEQTQACMDLAGKVGNNLGDHEIVRCSEDSNYFKNRYSSSNSGNVPVSSTGSGSPPETTGITGNTTIGTKMNRTGPETAFMQDENQITSGTSDLPSVQMTLNNATEVDDDVNSGATTSNADKHIDEGPAIPNTPKPDTKQDDPPDSNPNQDNSPN